MFSIVHLGRHPWTSQKCEAINRDLKNVSIIQQSINLFLFQAVQMDNKQLIQIGPSIDVSNPQEHHIFLESQMALSGDETVLWK